MNTLLRIIHPELLLNREKCRRNLERLCHKMSRAGVSFRPHFKTHQSREIGRWFRDYDVKAITTSSFRMALFFADDGWEDITVAFPVNLLEKDLINHLAGRIHLNVIAEDPQVIHNLDSVLNHKVGVFLKMDTGTHRTGLDPANITSMEACVDALSRSAHLVWKGFLSHAGHTYHVRHSIPHMQSIYQQALDGVIALKEYFINRFPDIIISFGDTPGASMLDQFPGIDEMRPGNFIFYDAMQVQIGSCDIQDVAVAMICPIVARHPERNECIVYGGGIHFSKDAITDGNGNTTYGLVVPYAEGNWETNAELGFVRSLSQEHGVIRVSDEAMEVLEPQQLVAVLPVHSCMTAQCMAGYLDQSGDRVDHFAGTKYYLH